MCPLLLLSHSVAVTLLRVSDTSSGYDTLLIKRGKAPLYGHWAFPGGSLEPGETILHAAQREMKEETSIHATPIEPFYVTEVLPGPGEAGGVQYVLVHVLAEPVSGAVAAAVRAADDAMEVRWMSVDEVQRMETAMGECGKEQAAVSVGGDDALIVPHVSDVLDRAIFLYERLFTKQ